MRRSRPGEVVCRCATYGFPHRFSGGRCTGVEIVERHWNQAWGGGACQDCHFLDDDEGDRVCQVVRGQERVTECPVWVEFVRVNEVRLGPRYGAAA